MQRVLPIIMFLMTAGCAGVNHQPTLDPIASQKIHVGEVMELLLTARDSDGDVLTLTATPLPIGATITKVTGGFLFTWAPLISDTTSGGLMHNIHFRLSDGYGGIASRWVEIVVFPQNSAPVFVGPSGYVFNLSQDDDISFRIAVKDDDSSNISFRIIEPIPGASLTQLDSKTMAFHWKPTEVQIATGNYWQLLIGASDETHDEVVKDISILLMNSDAAKNCPGSPPILNHVPLNTIKGSNAIVFRADTMDSESIVRELTVHFTTNNPLDPNSFSNNTLPLIRCNPMVDPGCPFESEENKIPYYLGSMLSPSINSTIPLLLHYYITATDNDDIKGTACDHITRMPKSGHYTMVVYPTAWSGACKDDPMEPNDTVQTAQVVSAGVTLDLRSCPGPSSSDFYEVPVGPDTTVTASILHEASHGELGISIHDVSGGQLAPPAGSAATKSVTYTLTKGPAFLRVSTPPGSPPAEQTYGLVIYTSQGGCPLDSLEINDNAALSPFVGSGAHTLTVCPGDQDWLKVSANAGETLILDLAFQHQYGDLDLRLYDSTQSAVAQSETATSDEHILYSSTTTGVYYVQVYGYQGQHNTGTLNIQKVPTNTLCVADMFSPNHSLASAMLLPENIYLDMSICPGKDDWYQLDVNAGERLGVAVAPSFLTVGALQIQMFQDGAGLFPIGTLTTENSLVELKSPSLKPGSVWWRVWTPGGTTFYYDMGFFVDDPPGSCKDDRFSPTTTPKAALKLSNQVGFVTRLKICPGGEDWFKIDSEAFNELYVYVYGFSNEAPLSAQLVQIDNNVQSVVVQGEWTTNGVELLYLPEENREYYIHVMGAPGAIHHYDLVIGID